MDNCINNAQQLAVLASTVAVALTENLTPSQQNVLGNLVTQIGSTILSIAATAEYCEQLKTSSETTTQESADTSGDNSSTTSSAESTSIK